MVSYFYTFFLVMAKVGILCVSLRTDNTRAIAPVKTFHCSSPHTWPRLANQHTCSPSTAIRQSPAPHWLLCQRHTSHHQLPCLRLPPGKLSQPSAPPTTRIPIGLTRRRYYFASPAPNFPLVVTQVPSRLCCELFALPEARSTITQQQDFRFGQIKCGIKQNGSYNRTRPAK